MEKLPLTSHDVLEDKIGALRETFPEAFSEGRIDFPRLRETLGDFVEQSPERYGLTWAGKSDAIRNLQTSSTGTLLPMPEESVNWETTENLLIEGDNLEVLKLLQDSYHNKVKMIYIDPPYNTGNEFIYPDNFREGLEDYLRYSGQVDGEGIKLSTNTETSGRFHSKWLTMMYPRLFLARNLLRDDGVIFVSIDDHEVHNLRVMMNEIFGEENFIASLVWQSKKGGGNDVATLVIDHQYVLAYGKIIDEGVVSKSIIAANPLDLMDEKGPYRKGRELNKWGSNSSRSSRPTMFFPIPGPNGDEVYPIRTDGSEGCWRWGKEKMQNIVMRGDVLFEKRANGTYVVYEKIRSDDPRMKPFRTWLSTVGQNAEGTESLKELFAGEAPFDFPKPLSLLKQLIKIGTNQDGIVLDFFAGSGSTAQAVIEQNISDSGTRQFILVQLPERTDKTPKTFPVRFSSIAEITRERVKRVISHYADKNQLELDRYNFLGFKSFKLSSSNFKVWGEAQPAEQIGQQLEAFASNIIHGRRDQDLLYEIVLKTGFPLTTPIETVSIGSQTVYSIRQGELFICLEQDIHMETIRAMVPLHPRWVICLDLAFHGNDTIKMNAKLELENQHIRFETV